MKHRQAGSYHTVYGEMDPGGVDEVLVFWHPNGLHCTLFFCIGIDYGGGIGEVVEINTVEDTNDVEKILADDNLYIHDLKKFLQEKGYVVNA